MINRQPLYRSDFSPECLVLLPDLLVVLVLFHRQNAQEILEFWDFERVPLKELGCYQGIQGHETFFTSTELRGRKENSPEYLLDRSPEA